MSEICSTCTYHMSGNPPACNALHTPTDGTIDCSDWQPKEQLCDYAVQQTRDLMNFQNAHDRELQRSEEAALQELRRQGLSEADIQERVLELQRRASEAIERQQRQHLAIRDARRFQAATRHPLQPSITLSQLREAMRGCPRPMSLFDVWRIPLPEDPMLSYSINSDPPAMEASIELVNVTPIETPNGLRWQFQGTVILD